MWGEAICTHFEIYATKLATMTYPLIGGMMIIETFFYIYKNFYMKIPI